MADPQDIGVAEVLAEGAAQEEPVVAEEEPSPYLLWLRALGDAGRTFRDAAQQRESDGGPTPETCTQLRNIERVERHFQLRRRVALLGLPAPPEPENAYGGIEEVPLYLNGDVRLRLPTAEAFPNAILVASRKCRGCQRRVEAAPINCQADLGRYLVSPGPCECEACLAKGVRASSPEALTLAALGRIEALLEALVAAEERKAAQKVTAA